MHAKRSLLILASVALGGLLLVGGFNALLDPFHVLHPALRGPDRFSTDQRYQVAGLITSYLARSGRLDAIVVGTSLDSGYDAAKAASELGVSGVLNLSINNSTPLERQVVLERALATGKVRRVLLGVFQNYADTRTDTLVPDKPMPVGLYQDALTPKGAVDRLQYLWSASVLKDSVLLALGRQTWSTDMLQVFDWNPAHIAGRDFERFSAPGRLEEHARTVARGKAAIAEARARLDQAGELEFPALGKHLLAVLRSNPGVRFDLVLAPVSALSFHEFSAEQLLRQIGLRLRLARELAGLPNARLYAFDTDWEVTENLANYRDSTHSCHLANERMLRFIALDGAYPAGRRLTPENVDGYVRELLDGLARYEVRSDRERSLWTGVPAKP